MKKLSLLVIGLLCLSVVIYAGEVITNDTGEDATGLRVSFSTPVLITAFGDILTSVDPQMLSYEFVFSGGVVEPWDSHWFNYSPTTASVMETEWLTGSTASGVPQGSLSRDDLMNLGRALTYEEIMSVIAEYPGPDEPLYVPTEDEAIWLTDLEGHADIYDNDSIKINYADWFDQSQIVKIEVFRNGIRMRFVPDMLDVLTNAQMKTFDGNPDEKTPASSHTDHCVWGYTYRIALVAEDGSPLAELSASVKAPLRLRPAGFLNIGIVTDIINEPYEWIVERFVAFGEMGFTGIQFSVYYITDSARENTIYALDRVDTNIHSWARTLSEQELRKVLSAIREAGLDAELRIEVWVSFQTAASDSYNHRGALRPTDLEAWFSNYTEVCLGLARVLQEEEGDVFTPIVELSSMERHGSHIEELLSQIAAVFTGRLVVSSQTNTHLALGSTYDSETHYEAIADRAAFWSFPGLEIGLNCWPSGEWEQQSDQRFSTIVKNLYMFWLRAFNYYSARYPEKPIQFSEMGNFNFDGSSRGYKHVLEELGVNTGGPHPESPPTGIDNQEDADLRAAMLVVADVLDATTVGIYKIYPRSPFSSQDQLLGDIAINGSPSVLIYSAAMGGNARQTGLDPSFKPCMSISAALEAPDWGMAYTLTWGSSPHITYVLEGTGVRPLSDADNWGLPGSRVSAVRAVALDGHLALRVELMASDQLGHYRYIFGFGPDNDRLYIFLNTDGRAEIAHQTPTRWEWLDRSSWRFRVQNRQLTQ